jgi:hypothetical protein
MQIQTIQAGLSKVVVLVAKVRDLSRNEIQSCKMKLNARTPDGSMLK